MSEQIATRLHRLAEIAEDRSFTDLGQARHYVIGDDLMAAFGRDDVQKSVVAMIDAGIARLPFPEVLIEFSVIETATRFIRLIEAHAAAMYERRAVTIAKEPAEIRLSASGLSVIKVASEADGAAIALAASFALLMLNVRGVEKRHIQCAALNKAREKSGKVRVPDHTILRIGVVYDREGKPVNGKDALRRVYLRAGHTRNQAIGKNWSEHKVIYIEPQLVNWRDGDAIEPRARKVVMG